MICCYGLINYLKYNNYKIDYVINFFLIINTFINMSQKKDIKKTLCLECGELNKTKEEYFCSSKCKKDYETCPNCGEVAWTRKMPDNTRKCFKCVQCKTCNGVIKKDSQWRRNDWFYCVNCKK